MEIDLSSTKEKKNIIPGKTTNLTITRELFFYNFFLQTPSVPL